MSLVVAFALGLNFSHQPAPKWFSPLLAGYLLENDETHRDVGVYDKKTGYYLVRYAECDGANLTLLLTRDRKMIQDQGYRVPSLPESEGNSHRLTEKPLPSLKTGKGIEIGDTQAQVQARLGKPQKVAKEGPANQYNVLSYQASAKGDPKTGELGRFWLQRYVFKENRLIEVCFYRGLE